MRYASFSRTSSHAPWRCECTFKDLLKAIAFASSRGEELVRMGFPQAETTVFQMPALEFLPVHFREPSPSWRRMVVDL